MQPIATDNLAELVRKKHQVLLQLRDVGHRQGQLVEEGASQQLMQLLAAKQHLISSLQMVERNLRPFQAEDPELRSWRTVEDRTRCAEQAEECRKLLAEVVNLEQQHEMRIVQHRDRVATQLKQADAAREAVGAYRQYRTDSGARPEPVSVGSHEVVSGRLDISSEAS